MLAFDPERSFIYISFIGKYSVMTSNNNLFFNIKNIKK
jgi:hypothetical protein